MKLLLIIQRVWQNSIEYFRTSPSIFPVRLSLLVKDIVVATIFFTLLSTLLLYVETHIDGVINPGTFQRPIQNQSLLDKKTFARLKPFAVEIINLKHSATGSGFHVVAPSGTVYILTNRHVCKEDSESILAVPPGHLTGIPRRVIDRDWNNDLCLVEGMPQVKTGLTISSSVQGSESIYILGYPGHLGLTLSKGNLQGIRPMWQTIDLSRCEASIKNPGLNHSRMQIVETDRKLSCQYRIYSYSTNAPVYFGSSGSMVVNLNDELVGVVWAKNDDETNYAAVVILEDVVKFLEHY